MDPLLQMLKFDIWCFAVKINSRNFGLPNNKERRTFPVYSLWVHCGSPLVNFRENCRYFSNGVDGLFLGTNIGAINSEKGPNQISAFANNN